MLSRNTTLLALTVLILGLTNAQAQRPVHAVDSTDCACDTTFKTIINDRSGMVLPAPSFWKTASRLAINPYSGELILAAAFNVYRSTDRGTTWDDDASVTTNALNSGAAFGSAADVFLATDDGIWKSSDSGKSGTWSKNFPDSSSQDTLRVWNLTYNSYGDVFAGTLGGNGLYRTTDGGATWDSINSGLRVNGTLPQSFVALAAIGDTLVASPDNDELFRSTDKGNSWNRVSGSPVSAQLYYDASTRKLYACSRDSIWVSDSIGSDWSHWAIIDSLDGGTLTDFVVSSCHIEASASMYSDSNNVMRGGRLLQSIDGGAHWAETLRDSSNLVYSLAIGKQWCDSIADSLDISYACTWDGVLQGCDFPACHRHIEPVGKEFTLCSDSNEVIYVPVEKGGCYTITVRGTYSMWHRDPDTCYGADAAWVYNVPAHVRGVAWSDKYPLPVWTGSNAHVGHGNIGIRPRYDFGFRYNDRPMPVAYDSVDPNHTYQVTVQSSVDTVFKFQILDYVTCDTCSSAPQRIPKYDDNCGCLLVTVQPCNAELCRFEVIYQDSICDGDTIKLPVGIQMDARIWQSDSSSVTGRTNILDKLDQDPEGIHKIGIVLDGLFVCPIDSIRCEALKSDSTRNKLAAGLLIDQSGSMASVIPGGSITKIDAAKSAVNGFVDSISAGKDTMFLMSFDDITYLRQDWTSDKQALKNAANSIVPIGGTSLYAAVITALQKLDTLAVPGYRKTLIVLSDGKDGDPNAFANLRILDVVRRLNIPIYVVALASDQDTANMGEMARTSGGRLISVSSADSLRQVFRDLAVQVSAENCCAIYFHSDHICDGDSANGEHFVRLIYAPQDTVIVTTVVKYTCPFPTQLCDSINGLVGSDARGFDRNGIVEVYPNPFVQRATLTFFSNHGGSTYVSVQDISGIEVMTRELTARPGENRLTLDHNELPPGTYFIVIRTPDRVLSRKVIVLR